MSIYGDIILDHYENPRNNNVLKNPSNSAHVDNPLCGDSLDMQATIKKGVLKDVGFTGQGCAISLASASILTEYAKGKKIKDLTSLTSNDVIGLLHIELTPNRLKCALLAWEGLMKLITI